MTVYRHTQVGWLMFGVGAFVLLLHEVILRAPNRIVAIPILVVTVLVLLFGTLTVTVDQEAVRARFGIGLVRKTVNIAEIESAEAVQNPWSWGWGIRFFPGGTLYNVSGLQAVELRLKDGRRVRIGTDEPQALQAAIAQARRG